MAFAAIRRRLSRTQTEPQNLKPLIACVELAGGVTSEVMVTPNLYPVTPGEALLRLADNPQEELGKYYSRMRLHGVDGFFEKTDHDLAKRNLLVRLNNHIQEPVAAQGAAEAGIDIVPYLLRRLSEPGVDLNLLQRTQFLFFVTETPILPEEFDQYCERLPNAKRVLFVRIPEGEDEDFLNNFESHSNKFSLICSLSSVYNNKLSLGSLLFLVLQKLNNPESYSLLEGHGVRTIQCHVANDSVDMTEEKEIDFAENAAVITKMRERQRNSVAGQRRSHCAAGTGTEDILKITADELAAEEEEHEIEAAKLMVFVAPGLENIGPYVMELNRQICEALNRRSIGAVVAPVNQALASRSMKYLVEEAKKSEMSLRRGSLSSFNKINLDDVERCSKEIAEEQRVNLPLSYHTEQAPAISQVIVPFVVNDLEQMTANEELLAKTNSLVYRVDTDELPESLLSFCESMHDADKVLLVNGEAGQEQYGEVFLENAKSLGFDVVCFVNQDNPNAFNNLLQYLSLRARYPLYKKAVLNDDIDIKSIAEDTSISLEALIQDHFQGTGREVQEILSAQIEHEQEATTGQHEGATDNFTL